MDEKMVAHVATIARLTLTDTEKKQFSSELKEVVDAFSMLDKVNTDDVEIDLHPIEIKNRLRDDEVEECLKDVLNLTENKKEDYFKGPKAV